MNKPVIVWCVIAGVLLFAVIFRAIDRYYTEIRHNCQKPRHLFEMAKEKDIFYIPGDVEDDGFDEL